LADNKKSNVENKNTKGLDYSLNISNFNNVSPTFHQNRQSTFAINNNTNSITNNYSGNSGINSKFDKADSLNTFNNSSSNNNKNK
jgi:hypothetical protein